MEESPDHEPTLIEGGMGVHLNYPIIARRGIRNPRPDRWGLWKPHHPSRGGTARARTNASRRARPDRLELAQARGLEARLHLLRCTEHKKYQSCARDRGRLEHRRCRLKQIPRTLVKTREKTPAGPLTWPNGMAFSNQGEDCPISKRQHQRDPNGYTRRCSWATVGENHRGPLNNQGKPA
jgi:hypothetical protein